MVSLMPAVLIGGPPHAGKSVLTYSLTQALRTQRIEHYVLRACPDGEGDWSQEINQEAVRVIRKKGPWTDAFVRHIHRDLQRRHLPLLVDVGGLPKDNQLDLISACTHSLLLLRADDPESASFWHHLVNGSGLLPLALLYSDLSGTSRVTSAQPIIEGTVAGLERGVRASGPVFDLLVARLVSLFSYSPNELEKTHLDMAPPEADLVVNLDTFIQVWAPQSKRWEPSMIEPLLAELPEDVPLAVYGRSPNWVYGALVMQTRGRPFYQFDSRLGWVSPPLLQIGIAQQSSELHTWLSEYEDATVLNVLLVTKYLDYTEAEHLPFPLVPKKRGLIINGVVPHWLLTALVSLYNAMELPWIACRQPQLGGAVVVVSRTTNHAPGDLLPLPNALE